jgi:release factor glutamine methyltransferase
MKARKVSDGEGQKDIRNVLSDATLALEHKGFATPRLDAEVLLSHCIKLDRLHLYAYPDKILSKKTLHRFQGLVTRRRRGEPVAYIIGQKEFWSLPFDVNGQVLIPRPETEILVEAILKTYSPRDCNPLMILEIGTGSGAISVALASELKNAQIVATDVSREALSVALENARENDVHHQISFRWGSLFDPVSEKFDIIVSNPPYISEEVLESLSPGVREFEPKLALLAGKDGTAFHREIIMQGAFYLKEKGMLFIEMGADQKNRVIEIFKESTLFDDVTFIRDYAGAERAFTARKKGDMVSG